MPTIVPVLDLLSLLPSEVELFEGLGPGLPPVEGPGLLPLVGRGDGRGDGEGVGPGLGSGLEPLFCRVAPVMSAARRKVRDGALEGGEDGRRVAGISGTSGLATRARQPWGSPHDSHDCRPVLPAHVL